MKLLFICTHNRCRSILFEAIAQQRGKKLIEARSAGSQPAGEIHPRTLDTLERHGYTTANLRSKSWDELETFAPDLVITVCDSAAGEACPVWFGNSTKIHWRLADPSAAQGNDEAVTSAFDACVEKIEQRTDLLLALIKQQRSPTELRQALLQHGAE